MPSRAQRRAPLTPSPEGAVEELEGARVRLRGLARRAIGIMGDDEAPPLLRSIRESGVGWYPLLALGLLVLVDEFQGHAIEILGPEIAGGLGISKTALAGALALKTLAITTAVLPIAAWVQNKPRRAAVSIATAFAWSVFTVMTGFVVSIWGLLMVMLADGATTGSVRAVHRPLIVDSYPPPVRVRGMVFYSGADAVGQMVGPLLVALCVVIGLTWRGVFLVLGAVCVLATFAAARLRDPGYGRWDVDKVRDLVRGDAETASELAEPDVELGFFEITRRLLLIPTAKRMLVGFAVLGMLLVPYTTFRAFFLQEQWGMGPGARALFAALMQLFALPFLFFFGRRLERMFRADPARLVSLTGTVLALAVLAISLAIVAPVYAVMVVLFGFATAMLTILLPAMYIGMFSIIPSKMRPHMSALIGIFLAAVGGMGGLVLLGGLDRRFGPAGAIASMAIPGVLAGFVIRSSAATVNQDIDRMLDEIVEEEEIRKLRHQGARLPMLACRHIDFSYGQLQVLFDVNFTVDDGELVALLGTNGAGKSTLLRVVSGLGLPSRGTVRFRGVDITFVDAERRVKLGVTQISGGKAVFRPLTVVENLRAFAYAHGANRRVVEAGLDASFDAFPRLAERRNQVASTMSGGEQQMLGLATAFILKPRLLLIDELSLGLAPLVVADLVE
ncbi:MAG: hypothetical protein QOI47_2048, partial [Actinomycetota bacterium]|nr:hypothetical protein [Actinomycetota bacterium]